MREFIHKKSHPKTFEQCFKYLCIYLAIIICGQ